MDWVEPMQFLIKTFLTSDLISFMKKTPFFNLVCYVKGTLSLGDKLQTKNRSFQNKKRLNLVLTKQNETWIMIKYWFMNYIWKCNK